MFISITRSLFLKEVGKTNDIFKGSQYQKKILECVIFVFLKCLRIKPSSYTFIKSPLFHIKFDAIKYCCCCCSITKLCLTLCDCMNCNTPGFPVLHYLPEFAQTHVHWVSDAIPPSHPLSSPSPPVLNLSQHQDLFQWVSSSYQVAKVLKLQHQPFQWIFRVDIL